MKTEKLSKLRSAWNELFDNMPSATPFVSHEWFSALARSILKTDPEVLVFYENSTIQGIIPAMISRRTIKMIGDEHVTDLIDLLSVPGHEAVIAAGLAEYIKEKDLSIDLYPFERNSPLIAGLKKHLPELIIEEQDECPLLNLPRTWADYLNNLDGKSRHELRRKMKKVNGAVIQDVKPTEIDRFLEFMAGSHGRKGAFLTPKMIRFFEVLIESFYKKGWLRLRAAIFEGQTIGMLLGFDFKQRVYLYNMGFDPELRTLSPGIVTIGLDIHAAIDEGYKYYDFLRGDEDYKYRLGAIERHTVRLKK
jgi:CelD/BcsL family acetyltransferase involved in cellulose biosynthesis